MDQYPFLNAWLDKTARSEGALVWLGCLVFAGLLAYAFITRNHPERHALAQQVMVSGFCILCILWIIIL